jgi:hypothetical protein
MDNLILRLVSADHFIGSGTFYVPLRCGGAAVTRGERVPFTVRVHITRAAVVNGAAVATRLHASYTNSRRINLTRCVAVPGHDAAVYRGRLVSG